MGEKGYRIQYGEVEDDGDFTPSEDVRVITSKELNEALEYMTPRVAEAVNNVFCGEI